MKTSLARTFLCAEENHNAADLLDESNESSYSFSLNGNAINHNKIFVYKTEESLILDRVTMMTSENIHLNNFMFEPIIDMSSENLKRLYKEVKSLNGTE